jgi:hypothetical protein
LRRAAMGQLCGGRWRAALVSEFRAVVSEETPPGPVDRAGIGLVALIELIHKPLIRPEVRARRPRHAIGDPRLTIGFALAIWRSGLTLALT